MNSSARLVLVIIIIAVLGAGGYLVLRSRNSDTTNTAPSSTPQASEPSQTNTQNTSSDTGSTKEAPATITYNGKGFSPDSVTVKAGDTIRITNSSDDPLDFDSDPHPTHTDEPELNVGDVGPGQSQTFTVTKTGTWGYHNHFDQSQRGSITVQ